MKLAGVVTLYHPDDEVLGNIESYLSALEVLYVMDNTETPDPRWASWAEQQPHVKYVAFHDNKGISYALNYALKETDFDYLLTMDQDSRFFPDMILKYKRLVEEFETETSDKVAMYAVNYDGEAVDTDSKRVRTAITSGSIVPVKIAIGLGGFDEALFIDEVDLEYCYRAEEKGYHIIEFPGIKMKHSIGNRTYHHLFSFTYNTFNHSAIRRYYIFRNKIYVAKRYPAVRKEYILESVKMIIKILLAEKQKANKMKYIFGGGERWSPWAYGEISRKIVFDKLSAGIATRGAA